MSARRKTASRAPARTQPIDLGEDLRIGAAREAFERFAQAGEGPVEIDASRLVKLDAAGLQALVAGTVRLRAAGIEWRWREPSGAFTAAARLAGLHAELGLP